MEEVSTTGVTIGESEPLGWLDGIQDIVFGGARGWLANQFPEQFAAPGTGEVRDSEVDAQLERARNGSLIFGLSTEQLMLFGGGLALAAFFLLRK